jgi:hypothetical protein
LPTGGATKLPQKQLVFEQGWAGFGVEGLLSLRQHAPQLRGFVPGKPMQINGQAMT